MYELTNKRVVVVCTPDINSLLYANITPNEHLYSSAVDTDQVIENHCYLVNSILSSKTKTKVLNIFHYLPENLPTEVKTNIVFVRDIYVNTPHGVWFGKMKESPREYETQIVKDIFKKLEIPCVGETTQGLLEGGDVCICNEDICFIGIGPRTNREGALEFIQESNLVCKKYVVIEPTIEDTSMYRIHLDCIFGVIDDKRCILWEELVTNPNAPHSRKITEYYKNSSGNVVKTQENIPFATYLKMEGFTIIPISDASQKKYGCNIVVLGKEEILVQDEESKGKIKHSQYIPFEEIHKMFGGLHCATNWL